MRKHFIFLAIAGSLSLAIVFFAALFSRAAMPSPASSGYHVIKTIPIGGEGGWDYLTVDSDARRVYVSRGTHVIVLDADTYAVASAAALSATAAPITPPFLISRRSRPSAR